MQFRDLPKSAMALMGLCFALMGALGLLVAAIGEFTQGRTTMAVAGCSFLVIATPFFAFLFSSQLARVLGVIVLLAFSTAMVWLAFRPANPAANPVIYQVGSIALVVLSLVRVGLGLWGKRSQPGT